jgi:hypothetical protein
MWDEKRYERYAAWCMILGMKAVTFEVWRREAAKIPDLLYSVDYWKATT